MSAPQVAGLVLAAGEGRRLGMPKALVADAQGTSWLVRAASTLRLAGIEEIYVVIGAAADRVRATAPPSVQLVEAERWAEGMGESLRAGLETLPQQASDPAAVVVMLVDTPDIGPDVVRRLLGHASADALARATYGGRPGHPVVLGRAHWGGVMASVDGDRGARDYLASHAAELVECGDLAEGRDIDTPEALERWRGSVRPDV